ncbi:hypothetical protein REPUB_Repub08aG0149400 [Reevesia pubescens]
MKWLPPSEDLAKINFDAAPFKDIKVVGIGVSIRDHNGEVLALLSCKKHGSTDPFIEDCIVMKDTMSFVLEIGFRNIVVERDSMLALSVITVLYPLQWADVQVHSSLPL